MGVPFLQNHQRHPNSSHVSVTVDSLLGDEPVEDQNPRSSLHPDHDMVMERGYISAQTPFPVSALPVVQDPRFDLIDFSHVIEDHPDYGPSYYDDWLDEVPQFRFPVSHADDPALFIPLEDRPPEEWNVEEDYEQDRVYGLPVGDCIFDYYADVNHAQVPFYIPNPDFQISNFFEVRFVRDDDLYYIERTHVPSFMAAYPSARLARETDREQFLDHIAYSVFNIEYDHPDVIQKLLRKKIPAIPNSAPMANAPGEKGGDPIMPFVNSGKGSTGGVPVHDDMPASSTTTGPINLPSDPQIRASRDMPAQVPLMAMTGGPPDLSMMNMYQDDILNLVYRPFHVGQVTIQGSSAIGSIVMRLPYGLNLLSVYGQNWARLHKRYNGRIRVTFSLSAVPMMRGNLLFGVVRNMPADSTTTIPIATLQKINWVLVNVSGSGDYAIDIGDARQTKFFRDTDEDPINGPPSDLGDRPGIICAVYTPLVNQFGPDSDNSVVVNIRSQAISPAEDPIWGFKAYEPIDAAVTTRSIQETPTIIYAKDIIPTIDNRSLYLDGSKVRTTTTEDLYQVDLSTGTFHGVHRAMERNLSVEPFWFSTDKKNFMVVMTEMDPTIYKWGPNARPVFTGTSYPFLSDLGNGLIITPNSPNNQFLGTIGGVESVALTNLTVTGTNGNFTTAVSLKEVVIANYTRGRFVFVFGEVTEPSWNEDIEAVTPVTGINGLHTLVWPLGSDSPTTTANLPNGYYNVVVATDGQNQYLATLGPSPALRPDKTFTQTILSLRNRLVGRDDSLTMDLIDARNNTTAGFLFTFGDQIVIRTNIPTPGSSHFRFNIDLEYMAFANPRESFGQPISDASRFLTPIDQVRGTSKYDVLRALQSIDRESLDRLFAEHMTTGPATPNGTAIGMGVAFGVSAAAGAIGKYFSAKNDVENQKALAQNYFGLKLEVQKKLNSQQANINRQNRGMANFQVQPGGMVANNLASRPVPENHKFSAGGRYSGKMANLEAKAKLDPAPIEGWTSTGPPPADPITGHQSWADA